MPPREPREHELQKEWRDSVMENFTSLNDRVHRQELELAVIKVKFAFVGAAVAVATSIITTMCASFVLKSLNLE